LILLAVFFFPIGVYCLVLGVLNRRHRPLVVSGTWDCLGLLLACSGAVLFAGPATLLAFYHHDVWEFLIGSPRWSKTPFTSLLTFHWLLWLLYFVAVLNGSALLIWWQRWTISVYNIEPGTFDDVLAQVLDRLGLEWTRMGERVFIGFAPRFHQDQPAQARNLPTHSGSHVTARMISLPTAKTSPAELPQSQAAVLDVVPFIATRHISVVWREGPRLLRDEFESGLRRALRDVPGPPNPAGTWFMAIAAVLFALICLAVGAAILMELLKSGD
jgi:hypothetical protein